MNLSGILSFIFFNDEVTITTALAHIGLILGFLLAVVLVSKIVRQDRRSPSATMAWLLIIVLVPWLGVPLYLMLGGRKVRRRAERKQKLDLRKDTTVPTERAELVDRILRNYNMPGATGQNSMKLCCSGEDGYGQLVKLIEGAQKSIHIETFVFGKDATGRDILQRLCQRAREGIEVRLLLDGVGCLHTRGRFLRPLIKAGGMYRHFNPVLHRPFRCRTNLRDHRKIAIADDAKVMAGGTNIAEEYIGPTPLNGRWYDLSFILQGPAVSLYAHIFRQDWEYASGEVLTPQATNYTTTSDESAIAQIVPSGPDIIGDCLYDALLSAIFEARERLWIVTPYFVPDGSLQQALLLARRRGVDVKILVPRKSNHRLIDFARGPFLRQLQDDGVIVMQHPEMIHAKVILMDDRLAMIGSSNFDIRSLFLNYEVSMFLYSQAEIRETEAWINQRLETCSEGVPPVGAVRDFRDGLARMLAPLL